MSADYPLAQAHFLDPEVMFNDNAHKAIVIHKTGGDPTPKAVYDTFTSSAQLPTSSPQYGRSAHFAIGQDGSIWQFVPLDKGAGANGIPGSNMDPFWQPYVQQYGNLNTCTISIEHCDPRSDNQTALTPAQKDASFKLVAWLCAKYDIPADHIKPHKSIADTACPGNYPMTDLIQFIKGGGSMIPSGWKDDGTTLTSPNGGKATLGFRKYILDHPGGWDASNHIIGEEFHADPLEYSNLSLGAGAKLCCIRTTLEYTPARGVFEAWQGQEVYALLQAMKAAQAKPTPAMDLSPVIASLRDAQVSANEVTVALAAALKEVGISV